MQINKVTLLVDIYSICKSLCYLVANYWRKQAISMSGDRNDLICMLKYCWIY